MTANNKHSRNFDRCRSDAEAIPIFYLMERGDGAEYLALPEFEPEEADVERIVGHLTARYYSVERQGRPPISKLRMVRREEGKSLRRSDAPMFEEAVFLTERAMTVMGRIIADSCESIPVSLGRDRLFALRSVHFIDPINYAACGVHKNPPFEDELSDIAFYQGLRTHLDVFRLPFNPFGCRLVVSNRFKDAWLSARLSGIEFNAIPLA